MMHLHCRGNNQLKLRLKNQHGLDTQRHKNNLVRLSKKKLSDLVQNKFLLNVTGPLLQDGYNNKYAVNVVEWL